jgi:hypothetical protein
MEGYWQLQNDPAFRTPVPLERHWGNEWYRYSVIDNGTNLSLQVLGQGYAQNRRRSVRLLLTRPGLSSAYTISSWNEEY